VTASARGGRWCRLGEWTPPGRGSVSRRKFLASPTLIGPCTTTIRGIPSEVLLEPGEDPIPRTSVVNLDSVESVSVGTLVERLGRLNDERMRQICEALEIAVGCEA
jgi:mRNA interferase MazF